MEEYVIVTYMFSVKYKSTSLEAAIEEFKKDHQIRTKYEILGAYKRSSLETILSTKFEENE